MSTYDGSIEQKLTLAIDAPKVTEQIVRFISTKMEQLQRDNIVLGLSGGLDSSVVAALCSRAVGPDNVIALLMPEKDSNPTHLADAFKIIELLKIRSKMVDLTPYLKGLGIYKIMPLTRVPFPRIIKESLIKKSFKLYERKTSRSILISSLKGIKDESYKPLIAKGNAYYRAKHRLRMLMLYLYAEQKNSMVVGTANKTEYKIGFFVKFGCDHCADIMPIIGLYKTQVKMLASYLDLPKEVIDKPPSPDIIPGIDDEYAIGMPYELLDSILMAYEKGLDEQLIADELNVDKDKIVYVKKLIEVSEHMRNIFYPELSDV